MLVAGDLTPEVRLHIQRIFDEKLIAWIGKNKPAGQAQARASEDQRETLYEEAIAEVLAAQKTTISGDVGEPKS